MDNVFIERLWRSLKHEDIYLKAYADGPRGESRHRGVDHVLQRTAISPGARASDADAGLARGSGPGRERGDCGDDGQR